MPTDRKIIFGTYDTAATGRLTLTGYKLSPAEYQSNIVEVPGSNAGGLDLSTALTDGEPRYKSRILTATFETSEGTRAERVALLQTMVNWLDGWVAEIQLPDYPGRYIRGRVHVAEEYNDLAHAAVTVTATCEPWLYAMSETVLRFTAAEAAQTIALDNPGRLTVVPLITITGDGASVLLVHGANSWALGPGVYQLPDIILRQGVSTCTISGSGSIEFKYREAVL